MTNLFLFLVALLYLLLVVSLIWSRLGVIVKALLILATISVSLFAFWVLKDAQGTPLNRPLPEEFLLATVLVREPNRNTHDSGAIYYVIVEDRMGLAVPRTYQRPYSNKRHSQASKLDSAIQKNKAPVWVQNRGDGEGEESADGAGKGQGVSGQRAKRALKKMAQGFGLYEDDSENNLELEDTNPLPPKG